MNFVVTGGASGVGEALVQRLAAHQVWVLDVNEPAKVLPNHHYLQTNLAEEQAIDEAIAELPAAIDGVANVAGMAQSIDPTTVVAVNFLALRHLSESLIPKLGNAGRIVNVSSVAGRDWQAKYDRLTPLLETESIATGLAWCTENASQFARDPYTFSKRLVTAYTLRSAQAGVAQGHRVNCVSPGSIETPLYPQFESLMGKAQSNWMKAQAGRAAAAEDIAEVIDMLLTSECGWLNGVDIPVDGGYTAGLQTGWIDFSQSPIMLARR